MQKIFLRLKQKTNNFIWGKNPQSKRKGWDLFLDAIKKLINQNFSY